MQILSSRFCLQGAVRSFGVLWKRGAMERVRNLFADSIDCACEVVFCLLCISRPLLWNPWRVIIAPEDSLVPSCDDDFGFGEQPQFYRGVISSAWEVTSLQGHLGCFAFPGIWGGCCLAQWLETSRHCSRGFRTGLLWKLAIKCPCKSWKLAILISLSSLLEAKTA